MNLTSVGVSSGWWLDTARLLEAAGFSGVWCWDHHMSRGRRKWDPMLECWTTLTAAAAATSRIHVGTFVLNVMNRHPALVARMAATLQQQSGGRLELGLGTGGEASEMQALGIEFPDRAERIARLGETLEVLRLLFAGGPADYDGRYYRLRGAWAHPVPVPPPRLIVAGLSAPGTRLAARSGDGWTSDAQHFAALEPVFREELESAGRSRDDVVAVASFDLPRTAGRPGADVPDLRAEAERWRGLGADELIVSWVRPHQVPALLAAAERAGLA